MNLRSEKNFVLKIVFLSCFLFTSLFLSAQIEDSVRIDSVAAAKVLIPIEEAETDTIIDLKEHSAYKAALYSAALPGLGQIYNKKYWKAPIVYIAYGVLGYYTGQMNYYYNEFRKAYADYYTDNIFDGTYDLPGFSPNLNQTEQLTKGINEFRRWRDLDIVMLAGLYFLNIIDATVDAHFFNFDVSNDLSLNFKPVYTAFNNNSVKLGLQVSIMF